MGVETEKPRKLRWGELEEEDGEDLDFLLPPKQVIGPDEHGIKKIIEYKFNEEGHKVKTTTTTRTRKIAKARLSKRAVERRSWPKFGEAVKEEVGSRLTMEGHHHLCEFDEAVLLGREITLTVLVQYLCSGERGWWSNERSGVQQGQVMLVTSDDSEGTKQEESKAASDPLAQLSKGTGGALMLCRTCGKKGDHWTSRCPYKDLAPQGDVALDKPVTEAGPAGGPSATKGAYVPPSMRAGAERPAGSDMRRRNEENSVRVTNLSEDTREPDLQELFRPFGAVSRVYVAIDQKTGVSRGFGFVNFVNKEDAQRAINKLNGYGYDNLILRVEWATPRN
ncbi:hypothetical protein KSS87_021867 [Heliosperma pusillum]|nr:hypothetical protein KSS87_021867 [Heliosperma pusillum]